MMPSGSKPIKRAAPARAALAIAIALLAAMEPANAQSSAAVLEPEQQSERRLVINVRTRALELFENGEWVKSYPIAVGRPSTPTPLGTFQISTKVKNPTWYGPNKQVIPPGKKNPVGTRWMGLDKKGYGIHGTNDPDSIGHAASRGCIRMLNREAEDLFARLEVGDQVEILAQPVTAGAVTLRHSYRPGGTSTGAGAGIGGLVGGS